MRQPVCSEELRFTVSLKSKAHELHGDVWSDELDLHCEDASPPSTRDFAILHIVLQMLRGWIIPSASGVVGLLPGAPAGTTQRMTIRSAMR